MRFAMRRSELPHAQQKTNLAEPLALKSWSGCTDRKITDFVKNGVFQHNRLSVAVLRSKHDWLVAAQSSPWSWLQRTAGAHKGHQDQRAFLIFILSSLALLLVDSSERMRALAMAFKPIPFETSRCNF
ncbi:hypothetical protein [Ruegeria atlantica]|uniref:hypothetical protein n=1 Tax=Ruegeria atlantica TaxID=81569 RepID=UPI001F1E2E85|nr:hypothetical protein [Ruegeria atlantica]